MSSRIEHLAEFPHPFDQVLSALSSEEALRDLLDHIGGQDAKLITHEDTGSKITYKLQQGIPGDKLPSAVRAMHSGDLMVNREQTWSVVSEAAATGESLASVAGVPGEIKATSELKHSDGKTVLRVSGEVKVRIPFIGGKIERTIAENVKRLLEKETVFQRDRLAGG